MEPEDWFLVEELQGSMWLQLVSILFDAHDWLIRLHTFFFAFEESIFPTCFIIFSFSFQSLLKEKWKLPKFGPPLVAETSLTTEKEFPIQIQTFLKIFIFRSKLPKFGPPWFQKWTKSIPNNWKRVPNSNPNFSEKVNFQVKIAEIWPSPGRKNERKTSQKDQKGFSIQILTFLKIFIFRSKLPKFGPMFIQWCQIRHIGSVSITSFEIACFESILIWRWIKTLIWLVRAHIV